LISAWVAGGGANATNAAVMLRLERVVALPDLKIVNSQPENVLLSSNVWRETISLQENSSSERLLRLSRGAYEHIQMLTSR
jgi:hypothetical protein